MEEVGNVGFEHRAASTKGKDSCTVHQTKPTCLVPLDTRGRQASKVGKIMYSLEHYIWEKGTLKRYSANLSRIHIYVLDWSIPITRF